MMFKWVYQFWVFALAGVSVQAHKKCGFKTPEIEEVGLDQARLKRLIHVGHDGRGLQYATCEQLCKRCILIRTAFHLTGITDATGTPRIPHPTFLADEYFAGLGATIPPTAWTTYDQLLTLINAQMQVLNDSFADTPFRFELIPVSTSIAANDDWTRYPGTYGNDISAALGIPGLDVLNVFLTYNAGDAPEAGEPEDGSITVAFASFPAWQYDKQGDGVFLRYDALPGGGFTGTDTGFTLTHEVGHWLGLYHVFQGWTDDNCSPDNPNDFVDDTPTMIESSQDYPPTERCADFLGALPDPDTCPLLPGTDPIFNYMNYVEDEECFRNEGHFSCGQIERMYLHWMLYRQANERCSKYETEITMSLRLSRNFEYTGDDGVGYFKIPAWYLFDENYKVIYNSTEDYAAFYTFEFQDTMVADLCLPKDLSYRFLYEDRYALGPPITGLIEILKDDKIVARRVGNFGRYVNVHIPKETPKPAPRPIPYPKGKGRFWNKGGQPGYMGYGGHKGYKGYKGYNKGHKGNMWKGYPSGSMKKKQKGRYYYQGGQVPPTGKGRYYYQGGNGGTMTWKPWW